MLSKDLDELLKAGWSQEQLLELSWKYGIPVKLIEEALRERTFWRKQVAQYDMYSLSDRP